MAKSIEQCGKILVDAAMITLKDQLGDEQFNLLYTFLKCYVGEAAHITDIEIGDTLGDIHTVLERLMEMMEGHIDG